MYICLYRRLNYRNSIPMKNQAFRFLAIFSFAIIIGCTQSDKAEESQPDEVLGVSIEHVELPAVDGVEKYVATLAIDGMGCAMACGSKISGTLAGLEGISKTDINFIGAGETNSAIVEFDTSQIDEEEMIEAVNNMTGGHYEVKKVVVVHYKPAASDAVDEEPKDAEKVSMSKPSFSYTLPNIFGVFSRLF